MYFLNVSAIIDHFNGAASIASGLEKLGFSGCTVSAIEKWRERDSISTGKLLMLKSLASSRKKQFNVDDFIQRKAA